jgi:pyrroline-5-carboxylate reductase
MPKTSHPDVKTKNMKIKEKIGMVGVGNMGAAILEGLFRKEMANASQVWVCDKIQEKAAEFSKAWGTALAPTAAGLANNVDVIVLAIKPQDLESMGSELRPFLEKHVLITILAGTPIAKIKRVLGEKASFVRAMPNLGAKVGEAITALSGANPQSLGLAEKIFSGCGRTVLLEERHFDLVTAVSGSGPAYFFYIIELLAKFAEREGLNRKAAEQLAIQTAVGAGRLAQTSEFSPEELRKMVTSKGGTTEAALKVLEEKGFGDIFHEALQAALRRGRELSQS